MMNSSTFCDLKMKLVIGSKFLISLETNRTVSYFLLIFQSLCCYIVMQMFVISRMNPL